MPSRDNKGYINARLTAWCGCGHWLDITSRTKREARLELKKHGWRCRGWEPLCPTCVRKEVSRENQGSV